MGENAEGQFIATGFSGNGMTFGTLAAMMAVDAAQEKKSPWQELYSVNRHQFLGGTWDWLKENLDYPYYLVRDSLKNPTRISPAKSAQARERFSRSTANGLHAPATSEAI